jgi:2'-5' RNA ligase
VGFDGARNDKLCKVLHEIAEEDKGKKITLEGFKSFS